MNTNVTIERTKEAPPGSKARIAGVFYLLTFILGGLAMFARQGLIVTGDAAATATNLLAHEFLFRLGFAGDLLVVVCYITVTVLLYSLFKPVNRRLSLHAASFSFAACAILGFTCLFQLAPFVILQGPQYASVFQADQLKDWRTCLSNCMIWLTVSPWCFSHSIAS